MPTVIAKPNESFDSLLRRFKRKVVDARIVSDYRERTYFTSPSQKRRLYEKEKQKKIRKANARKLAEFNKDI